MSVGQAVATQLSRNAEMIHLMVENPGMPTAVERPPRLLGRFYHVNSSRQRKGEDSGIGLATVESVISARHSSVAVQFDLRSTRLIIMLLK